MIMVINELDKEESILKQLHSGSQEAFAELYHHYYPSVLAQVVHLVHSSELAEDVTQEIFLKIWEGRDKLEDIQSFKSYLFIVARNHTLNVLKSAARSEAAMGEIVRHFGRMTTATQDEVLTNEYLRFIQQKLEELPPRSREIFRLCREQSKTYNEVATELGISRDAVKSRMMHAMKVLRDAAEREMGLPLVVILVLASRF